MPITIQEQMLLDLLQAALPGVRYVAADLYRQYAIPGTDWNRLAGRIEAALIAAGREVEGSDGADVC